MPYVVFQFNKLLHYLHMTCYSTDLFKDIDAFEINYCSEEVKA